MFLKIAGCFKKNMMGGASAFSSSSYIPDVRLLPEIYERNPAPERLIRIMLYYVSYWT